MSLSDLPWSQGPHVPISGAVFPDLPNRQGSSGGPSQQLPPSHGVTVVLGLQRSVIGPESRGRSGYAEHTEVCGTIRMFVRGRTHRRGHMHEKGI